MRWKQKYPKTGDYRIKIQFLWLPKTLQGQTIWLEKVFIQQVYGKELPPLRSGESVTYFEPRFRKWEDVRFIFKENK